jgi:HSP20 family molecular chaperone IbpA
MVLAEHLLGSLLQQSFYSFPDSNSKPPWSHTILLGENKKQTGIRLDVALAGVKEEHIEVSEEDKSLYIKVDNSCDNFVPDRFRINKVLSFALHKKFDLSQSSVLFENGLLTIEIPIKEELLIKKFLFGGPKE